MSRLEPVYPLHDEDPLRGEVPVDPRHNHVHLARSIVSPTTRRCSSSCPTEAPAVGSGGADAASLRRACAACVHGRTLGWRPVLFVRASSAAWSISALPPSFLKSSSMFWEGERSRRSR